MRHPPSYTIMLKSDNKSNQREPVQTADDFDDMQTEPRAAANIASESAASSTTRATASSSGSTTRARSTEEVSEDSIIEACRVQDMSKLRRWARQGV